MNVVRENGGLRIDIASEDETTRLGRALAALAGPGTVIALVGPLGAGKTQLARAIAEARGVDPEDISSPTFVLIHEYAGDIPIYHADVFRLENPSAFLDLGIVDYFGGDGICVIEWADRVASLIPADAWWIDLTLTGPTTRTARFRAGPAVTQLNDELARRLS